MQGCGQSWQPFINPVRQLARVDKKGLGRHAQGQELPVPINNRSPLRGPANPLVVLTGRPVGQLPVLDNCQLNQPAGHQHESEPNTQRGSPQPFFHPPSSLSPPDSRDLPDLAGLGHAESQTLVSQPGKTTRCRQPAPLGFKAALLSLKRLQQV